MESIDLSPSLNIKYSNDREPRSFCFTHQVIHVKKLYQKENFNLKKNLDRLGKVFFEASLHAAHSLT